jgi:hypothetical protein
MAGALGLVGAAISIVTGRYVADFELPIGSILTFKDAEAILRSPVFLNDFTKARGIADTEEARTFAAQLAADAAGPLRIGHRLVVTRTIIRDVPDSLASNLFKNMNPVSTMYVSSTDRTPEAAVREAELGLMFIRAVLIERALSQIALEWKGISAGIPNQDAALLAKGTEIASLERTIAAMSELDDGVSGRVEANSAANSAVQLQVTAGSSYLPSAQQIIGFKSRRIAALEELKTIQDDLVQAKALNAAGDELASMMSQDHDHFRVLDSSIERGRQQRASASSVPEQKAADATLSRFLSVKQLYVETPANPPRPNVRRTGIGLLTSTAIGVLAALAIWAAILALITMFGSLTGFLNNVQRRLVGDHRQG